MNTEENENEIYQIEEDGGQRNLHISICSSSERPSSSFSESNLAQALGIQPTKIKLEPNYSDKHYYKNDTDFF